jgi:uroporphyrinogen-III synthase
MAMVTQAFGGLDSTDWLIFTSPNAVIWTYRHLAELGHDYRVFSRCRIAAVGQVTADTVRAQGASVDLIPEHQTAEGLFQAMVTSVPDLAACRVLLPQADLAQDTLQEALAQHGAMVTRVTVYRTIQAPLGPELQRLASALRHDEVDVITFASSSAVRYFQDVMQSHLPDPPGWLSRISLAALGPQTAQTLRQSLGRVDIEARHASLEGLASAIIAYYDPNAPSDLGITEGASS